MICAASLKLSFHVLNLYMHEIATHSDFADDFRTNQDPFREAAFHKEEPSDTPLTPAHINAISACLTAIDGIFEVWLSLEPADIRCLPVFNFVRVAYAVVVLIKMYFAASSTKSELGKVINKDNMKVEQHLESLLEKFRATAADDRSRPAAKFLVVLVMLRSWFHRQKQSPSGPGGGYSNGSKASSAPDNAPTPYQGHGADNTSKNAISASGPPPDYSTTANTPLQLLSEVATNDSAATPRGSNAELLAPANANSVQWYGNTGGGRPQPPPPQPYMYEHSDGTPTSAGAGSGPPPPPASLAPSAMGAMNPGPANPTGTGVMPWLNNAFTADFDYANLSDDITQAMDWTLEELADGSMGMGMENGMRYIMQEPPWFAQMQQMGISLGGMMPGMVVDGMGGNGGGAQGGPGTGPGGMFPF